MLTTFFLDILQSIAFLDEEENIKRRLTISAQDAFLAPSGAQEVTMFVCPSSPNLSKALNLHIMR